MTDDVNPTPAAQAGEEPRTPEEIRADIEQTREQLGETVEALAAKTDVKARAQDRIEAAKENVAHLKDDVAHLKDDVVAKARQVTPDSAGASVHQVSTTVQERPLPFATAGAFAAGLVVGWLLGRR
jgi:hypothetical protein